MNGCGLNEALFETECTVQEQILMVKQFDQRSLLYGKFVIRIKACVISEA